MTMLMRSALNCYSFTAIPEIGKYGIHQIGTRLFREKALAPFIYAPPCITEGYAWSGTDRETKNRKIRKT